MDAIISIDVQQNVVLFNAAAEQMFGRTAQDAMGRPLDDFIPERFRAAHANHVRAFGETGVSGRAMGRLGDLKALRADGVEFPIEAAISQAHVDGETLFTVIVRDISRGSLRLKQSDCWSGNSITGSKTRWRRLRRSRNKP